MNSRIWKIGTRRAMVYVEGREAAGRVREAAGLPAADKRRPDPQVSGVIAVYSDRKGRDFAWQILFDSSLWNDVAGAAGIEVAP